MATVTKVIMDKDDLQPLADEIKELEGNVSNITLSQMENAISSANSEISRQSNLISEIVSALEGKGAGSGSGSGSSAEFESGILTGVTTYGMADSDPYYYYDVSCFSNKLMVVLCYQTVYETIILARHNLSDLFDVAYSHSSGMVSPSLVEENIVKAIVPEYSYYAI